MGKRGSRLMPSWLMGITVPLLLQLLVALGPHCFAQVMREAAHSEIAPTAPIQDRIRKAIISNPYFGLRPDFEDEEPADFDREWAEEAADSIALDVVETFAESVRDVLSIRTTTTLNSPSSQGKIWEDLGLPGTLQSGAELRIARTGYLRGGRRHLEEVDFLDIKSTWTNVALTFICVVCAGLAAGLTMGLVSIEPLEMAIKQRSGTPDERRQASRILPLVNRHHFLLVTLLVFNSLANEALPVFLGNLVPSWLAIILSVTLVLFFGEILPSAIFTGKAQLAIASGMAWFVYVLMFVLSPIAWPVAWILDRVLGIEGFKRYNRAEIAALVEVQQELSAHDVTNLPLHPDEVAIVNGVLQTAEKNVSEAMITMDKVFCLRRDERLGATTMADIMASGYSRVLVYEGEDTRNIRGYLQVKKLIVLSPDDERDISSLALRLPVVVAPSKSLLELLNTFQTGRSHLALVSKSPGITLECLKSGVRLEGAARPVGIITLEDIIEEIIQEEILDESDRMTEFIEKRARETLRRFALKGVKEGKLLGRHAVLGRTAPVTNTASADVAMVKTNGGVIPSLSSSHSARSITGPSTLDLSDVDPVEDPPAPPGLSERSRLLAHGNYTRRSPSVARGGKRCPTMADAMIAVAASHASDTTRSTAPGSSSMPSSLSLSSSYGAATERSGLTIPRLGQGKVWSRLKSTSHDSKM